MCSYFESFDSDTGIEFCNASNFSKCVTLATSVVLLLLSSFAFDSIASSECSAAFLLASLDFIFSLDARPPHVCVQHLKIVRDVMEW